MIRREELGEIAKAKRISLENCEKDYILELLMFSIFSEAGDSLALKGGTAMYKFYNLNRFSEDLDFSVNKRRVDLPELVNTAMRRLSGIGVPGSIRMESYRNEVNARLMFRGPLYDGSKESMVRITLNFSKRDKPINVDKLFFIPVYTEIPSFNAFVMAAEEIFAEKVRAIFTRNKPRDVYDLWFLLKRKVIPDIALINVKLKTCNLQFSGDEFVKKVDEKRGLFGPDMNGLIIGELEDFEIIKKEILDVFRG
ncbi:MAG: nucleotidyl transferase AbiEii/AbiGii toxin family protein [archaeon]|nr:nucleotidyl transferase AbiEii/AbiGii toxin family protein [archaeon]